MATGNSDNSIRVYQLEQNYLTHCFKQHKAPILSLAFHPTQLFLASSSHDYTVRVFDLMKYSCAHTMTFLHPTRFLGFLEKSLVTCTSEEVKLWSIKNWKSKGEHKAEADVSAFEISGGIYVGDEKGNLTKLSKNNLSVVKTQNISNFGITLIKEHNTNLVVANQEFSVYFYNKKFKLEKEIIGHIDEVLDLKYISDFKAVLALNSSEAKIIDLNTSLVQSLRGHTDNILCVDILGDHIATSSKDQTVKYWNLTELLATYSGHTEEVTSVAISKKDFLVSSSQDRTLKVWEKTIGDISTALHTCIAHQKDIGVVRLSPDSKVIASGSHDKLIKL